MNGSKSNLANKVTGANAGGPDRLAIRTSWAARIAQFCRLATMRALLPSTFVLAIVLIVSCSRSGDFGAFIVPQVTKYGGHSKISGIIPNLEARWTVKEGANGFTAHVTDVPFSAVDGFMRKVYGTPDISMDTGVDGEQKRVWEAADIGVGIQLIGHKNNIEIICVGAGP